MSFQSGPQVRVVGSRTAGADGNVSKIPIPGGHRTQLSSVGVFYPDKSPTQRDGVAIDIEVHPTVEGIRRGRDEVLEAALQWIWNDSDSEAERIEAARRVPAP
jgi:C-terminal processing protease CtpA/Prc